MTLIFPVLESVPAPFASRTKDVLLPLSTIIFLKVEEELPLIVLFVPPLKVTVPAPASNVPLFVQSPFTSRLTPPLKLRIPLIVRLEQDELTSITTVDPLVIVTSSLTPGITPPTQVVVEFQLPPAAVDEICAKRSE